MSAPTKETIAAISRLIGKTRKSIELAEQQVYLVYKTITAAADSDPHRFLTDAVEEARNELFGVNRRFYSSKFQRMTKSWKSSCSSGKLCP